MRHEIGKTHKQIIPKEPPVNDARSMGLAPTEEAANKKLTADT